MSINVLSHLRFKHGTNIPANIWWTQKETASLGRGQRAAQHSASLLQGGLPWPHSGAWARWCLYNYTPPWKTHWQAKERNVLLFRTSPSNLLFLLLFLLSLPELPWLWLVKHTCMSRSVEGLRRLCLHAQLVCLSWYLLTVSFLLLPHTHL